MREKGGLVFRFYLFKGWFGGWFFDPVIYSQSSSLLLLANLLLVLLLVYVSRILEESRENVSRILGKVALESVPNTRGKSHRITQICGNRRFKASDESGVRGYFRTQPDAGKAAEGRERGT